MDVHKFFVLLSVDAVLVLFFYAHSSEGFLWWGSKEKKIDGKWSAWSSYSSCQIPLSKDSYPYRFKQRSCTQPAPKNDGKPCAGQSRRNTPCSDCDTPLGMESKRIDDSQVTASTFHAEFPPHKARLNGPSAWCAGNLGGEVYLQVDLQGLSLITAVATQGFYPDPKKLSLRLGSVSKYRITFSDDGTSWEVHQNRYGNHSVFNGNKRDSKTVLNILEPNIAARYVRIVPTARIHFACMKLELYGCKFKCGGYLPQAPGDLLAASLETENIDCFWQVHLPKSTKINFDFINFDLPCSMGQVDIRGSGSSFGRSQLLAHLCDYISAPPPVVSNGNKMWIRFQSNSSDPLIGLYGTYFPNCDYQYNSSEGALTTPNFPKNYNHNSLCKWLISVSKGKAVKLTFFDFEVEGDLDDGPKCSNDHVIVTEGNASKTVGRFCNTNRPPKYLCSHSNRIAIQFKSDDMLSFKGFNALYKAKEPNAPCIEPSSTIITPSPTISIFSSTIAPQNYSSSAILGIIPTATVAMSSTVISNSSIGILGARPGLTNVMGQKKNDENDDDKENGLTTIIIISVFSFIVLVMIIASIIPSLIHGCDKRKREREWLAAAAASTEKKNCVGNIYEMQPIKSSVNVEEEKPEPNETTAFLAPEHDLSDKHITATCNAAPYPSVEEREEIDGSATEEFGCDLEYDPTDLNLNVSYEDLGTSFATEMAIMMNHISPGKDKSESNELPKSENDDNSIDRNSKAHENKTIENNNDNDLAPQEKSSQDTLENETSEDNCDEPSEFASPEEKSTPDDIDSAEVVAGIEEKNDKLQKALNDLKATLTQDHSDSGSIPEIHNPDTNSTVSVSGSQEIDNLPPVDIINPIWERNTTNDPARKRPQEEDNESKHGADDNLSVPGNDKDSGHYSSSSDHATLGTETFV